MPILPLIALTAVVLVIAVGVAEYLKDETPGPIAHDSPDFDHLGESLFDTSDSGAWADTLKFPVGFQVRDYPTDQNPNGLCFDGDDGRAHAAAFTSEAHRNHG